MSISFLPMEEKTASEVDAWDWVEHIKGMVTVGVEVTQRFTITP